MLVFTVGEVTQFVYEEELVFGLAGRSCCDAEKPRKSLIRTSDSFRR